MSPVSTSKIDHHDLEVEYTQAQKQRETMLQAKGNQNKNNAIICRL